MMMSFDGWWCHRHDDTIITNGHWSHDSFVGQVRTPCVMDEPALVSRYPRRGMLSIRSRCLITAGHRLTRFCTRTPHTGALMLPTFRGAWAWGGLAASAVGLPQ